jgi:hypothetical protein
LRIENNTAVEIFSIPLPVRSATSYHSLFSIFYSLSPPARPPDVLPHAEDICGNEKKISGRGASGGTVKEITGKGGCFWHASPSGQGQRSAPERRAPSADSRARPSLKPSGRRADGHYHMS